MDKAPELGALFGRIVMAWLVEEGSNIHFGQFNTYLLGI